MTIRSALHSSIPRLRKAGIDSASLDAEVILAWCLKKDRVYVLAHTEKSLTPAQEKKFNAAIKKRVKRVPVAYITGKKEFFGLDFSVTRDTLIPRPETEHLVEEVLTYLASTSQRTEIIDIGTGSGAIALALASRAPKNVHITTLEKSKKALMVAKKNAKLLGLSKKITFKKSDLLSALSTNYLPTGQAGELRTTNFPILISNLPYLSTKEYQTSIKRYPEMRYEPRAAFVGGANGMSVFNIFFKQLSHLCTTGTHVFLEIGPKQGLAIKKLTKKNLPGAELSFRLDECGKPRIAHISIP